MTVRPHVSHLRDIKEASSPIGHKWTSCRESLMYSPPKVSSVSHGSEAEKPMAQKRHRFVLGCPNCLHGLPGLTSTFVKPQPLIIGIKHIQPVTRNTKYKMCTIWDFFGQVLSNIW